MAATNGLERTLRHLTKTPNPAAIEVLDAGLRSDEPAVRAASARSLAARRGADAGRALLHALPETSEDVLQAVVESEDRRRLRPTVAKVLKEEDHELARRACIYAQASRDAHLIAPLAETIRRGEHPYQKPMAHAALRLAEELVRASDAFAVGDPEVREDPAFARRVALTHLGRAVDDFGRHGEQDLLTAYLMLTVGDDLLLRQVLEDPTHTACEPLFRLLSTSRQPPIMRLVSHALTQERPAGAMVRVLTSRFDQPFVELLLDEFGDHPSARMLEAVQKLEGFAWADASHDALLLRLTGERQAAALRLVAETRISKRRLTDLVSRMLQEGQPAARVAACKVAGKVKANVATDLIRRALEDDDPSVVAAAAAQLRRRGVEGSTEKLIHLLDHRDAAVKSAAQQELDELTYESFVRQMKTLDEQQRIEQARLVAKGDPACAEKASKDLSAASLERKLFALEVIEMLGVGGKLTDDLIPLLSHRDNAIRAAAARALAGATGDDSLAALTAILNDVNATVRDAARFGLAAAGVAVDSASTKHPEEKTE